MKQSLLNDLMAATFQVGKPGTGCVVSTEPICEKHNHEKSGHADTSYYGGYLIAESIPSKELAEAIAMLPQMAKAYQCLKEFYEQVNDTGKMVFTKDSIYYIAITELILNEKNTTDR
jgi:hypothetical protein